MRKNISFYEDTTATTAAPVLRVFFGEKSLFFVVVDRYYGKGCKVCIERFLFYSYSCISHFYRLHHPHHLGLLSRTHTTILCYYHSLFEWVVELGKNILLYNRQWDKILEENEEEEEKGDVSSHVILTGCVANGKQTVLYQQPTIFHYSFFLCDVLKMSRFSSGKLFNLIFHS